MKVSKLQRGSISNYAVIVHGALIAAALVFIGFQLRHNAQSERSAVRLPAANQVLPFQQRPAAPASTFNQPS